MVMGCWAEAGVHGPASPTPSASSGTTARSHNLLDECCMVLLLRPACPEPRQWKRNASTHAGITVPEHTLLRATTESQGDSSEHPQHLPVEWPDPPPGLQVRVPGPVVNGGGTGAVMGEACVQAREDRQAQRRQERRGPGCDCRISPIMVAAKMIRRCQALLVSYYAGSAVSPLPATLKVEC